MTEGDPTNDPFYVDPEKNPIVDAEEAHPMETPAESEPTGFAMVEEKPKPAVSEEEEELVLATIVEGQESQEELTTVLGILGDEISLLAEMAADMAERASHPTTEEQRSWLERVTRSAKARVALTVVAFGLAGTLSRPAQAAEGDGGRRAARIGAYASETVEYEMQRSTYEAMRNADELEYALQKMERDQARLEQSFERLTRSIRDKDRRLKEALAKNDGARAQRLLGERDEMLEDQAQIRAQAAHIDELMVVVEKRLEKAEKDIRKKQMIGAGLRVLGDILRSR